LSITPCSIFMEGKEKVPMNGWLNLKSSCRCITIPESTDESIQS
jgi:hypothetical protein